MSHTQGPKSRILSLLYLALLECDDRLGEIQGGDAKAVAKVGAGCKFTTDVHHSPTLVKGNCPLSVLVRLVTTRLYRNTS